MHSSVRWLGSTAVATAAIRGRGTVAVTSRPSSQSRGSSRSLPRSCLARAAASLSRCASSVSVSARSRSSSASALTSSASTRPACARSVTLSCWRQRLLRGLLALRLGLLGLRLPLLAALAGLLALALGLLIGQLSALLGLGVPSRPASCLPGALARLSRSPNARGGARRPGAGALPLRAAGRREARCRRAANRGIGAVDREARGGRDALRRGPQHGVGGKPRQLDRAVYGRLGIVFRWSSGLLRIERVGL